MGTNQRRHNDNDNDNDNNEYETTAATAAATTMATTKTSDAQQESSKTHKTVQTFKASPPHRARAVPQFCHHSPRPAPPTA